MILWFKLLDKYGSITDSQQGQGRKRKRVDDDEEKDVTEPPSKRQKCEEVCT